MSGVHGSGTRARQWQMGVLAKKQNHARVIGLSPLPSNKQVKERERERDKHLGTQDRLHPMVSKILPVLEQLTWGHKPPKVSFTP